MSERSDWAAKGRARSARPGGVVRASLVDGCSPEVAASAIAVVVDWIGSERLSRGMDVERELMRSASLASKGNWDEASASLGRCLNRLHEMTTRDVPGGYFFVKTLCDAMVAAVFIRMANRQSLSALDFERLNALPNALLVARHGGLDTSSFHRSGVGGEAVLEVTEALRKAIDLECDLSPRRELQQRQNPSEGTSYRDKWEREQQDWYDRQTTSRLRTLYSGAWDANDVDSARNAVRALRRRGEDVSMYRWGSD